VFDKDQPMQKLQIFNSGYSEVREFIATRCIKPTNCLRCRFVAYVLTYTLQCDTTGVAKYSDFGPIEGYISETVQDR